MGCKMNHCNEHEEVFIFMTGGPRGKMIKVVLNRLAKTCTVYSDDGAMLMKLEKLTPRRMVEIRTQITQYIARSKFLHGSFLRGTSDELRQMRKENSKSTEDIRGV